MVAVEPSQREQGHRREPECRGDRDRIAQKVPETRRDRPPAQPKLSNEWNRRQCGEYRSSGKSESRADDVPANDEPCGRRCAKEQSESLRAEALRDPLSSGQHAPANLSWTGGKRQDGQGDDDSPIIGGAGQNS